MDHRQYSTNRHSKHPSIEKVQTVWFWCPCTLPCESSCCVFFWPIAFLFFWLQAARVRVPGRLPLGQLKLPQRTDPIVETKRSSSMAKTKIELIKQTNKQSDPPRSNLSGVKRRQNLSGVKSSTVHKQRRKIGAESLGSRYL